MDNFRILKPKNLAGLRVNVVFDVETDIDYKSRLKMMDWHKPMSMIGFIPMLAIENIKGHPAKNGKVTIVSRLGEDNKLVLENDEHAVATKLLVHYQLLLQKGSIPSESHARELLESFKRPIKYGTHNVPQVTGEDEHVACALLELGTEHFQTVFVSYLDEKIVMMRWWVHLRPSEREDWAKKIMEHTDANTVYMEPVGKTWAASNLVKLKNNITRNGKDRRRYAIKILEEKLFCHDKARNDKRTIEFKDIDALSVERHRPTDSYKLAIVQQNGAELHFTLKVKPTFIEEAIIPRLSWRKLDASDVVFCSNATVSINFEKRYEQLISIVTVRNRHVEIHPLQGDVQLENGTDSSVRINIRDIIDPVKCENTIDTEKLCEKIIIKTPKLSISVRFSTHAGTRYFVEHLSSIMRFTDGTIDEQMILGGIPRLVKTCTSYVESYGLRLTGIYRVSGASARIKALEDKFTADPLHFDIDSTIYKVHDVAVLLKRFFRQLKMPLFKPDDRWSEVFKLEKDKKEVQAICLASQIIASYSEITQSTINHMISHLYLITLLEKENSMGSSQLSIIFGTTFFGNAGWKGQSDMETTAVKNEVLNLLIREARNVCQIPNKQFKQMIQITEQLTENCFISVKFIIANGHTVFRFHPKKTVAEMQKRLVADLEQLQLVLTLRREQDQKRLGPVELVVDQTNMVLGDVKVKPGQLLEAIAIPTSLPEPNHYVVRHPENGTLVATRVDITCDRLKWDPNQEIEADEMVITVYDSHTEFYAQHGMMAIGITRGERTIHFMVDPAASIYNAMLHFYTGLKRDHNSPLDKSDLIVPL